MSHLHLPDGILPLWIWAPAWGLAALLLFLSSRSARGAAPQAMAFKGAVGALALAAMAIEIPLGPIEYHLTLVGPVGVLLGPTAAFQALFVASAMLAFVGHGGFTVIGLNALVLGAGAAIAHVVFRRLGPRQPKERALAIGTACGQMAAGALWLSVMTLALRFAPSTLAPERAGLAAALVLPLWIVGIVVEAAAALGIGRFLERVRPDLLARDGAGTRAPEAR